MIATHYVVYLDRDVARVIIRILTSSDYPGDVRVDLRAADPGRRVRVVLNRSMVTELRQSTGSLHVVDDHLIFDDRRYPLTPLSLLGDTSECTVDLGIPHGPQWPTGEEVEKLLTGPREFLDAWNRAHSAHGELIADRARRPTVADEQTPVIVVDAIDFPVTNAVVHRSINGYVACQTTMGDRQYRAATTLEIARYPMCGECYPSADAGEVSVQSQQVCWPDFHAHPDYAAGTFQHRPTPISEALLVPCPTCKRMVGKECRTRKGGMCKPHERRREAARQARESRKGNDDA